MSYDRSQSLQLQREQNNLDPPPSYRRRPSVKAFLKRAIPVALLAAVTLTLLWILIGFKWWYVFIVFASWYFMYREYYKWSRNHLTCHPTDGVLHVEDHSHPIILFFITGSSDDQLPLDEISLDTPTRSVLDRYIFHCCTLIAGDRTLKDVRYVDELLLIHKYRDSLKKQSIVLDKEQVDYLAGILETLESMGQDIKTLVDFIVTKPQPVAPPPIDHAQPIPVRKRTSLEKRVEAPPSDDEESTEQ